MFRAVAPLIESSCDLSTYPVLAPVSRRCPGHMGRLPTCYSPVRHWLPKKASFSLPSVRLACIRHAASVHPEPGSNSPLFVCLFFLRCRFQRLFFLYPDLDRSFLNWRFLFGFQRSGLPFRKRSFILPFPPSLCQHLFLLFLHFLFWSLNPIKGCPLPLPASAQLLPTLNRRPCPCSYIIPSSTVRKSKKWLKPFN